MTLVDNDLLTRYLSGDCTPFERARVERWLGESPDHEPFIMALREVATDTGGLPAERKAAMLAAVKGSSIPARSASLPDVANGREKRRFVFAKSSSRSVLRAAAALVLAVGAMVAGNLLFRARSVVLSSASVNGLRTFTTAPGQRLAFRLPDGTAVTMAPASFLQLHPDYGTRTRVVDLEGEAVFTVSHDTARPFTVRTPRGLARDLGTRFVVRAYPGDPITEVVVAEGLVAVWPDTAVSRGDSVLLAPGERARIAADGRVAVSDSIPLDPYFAWTAGRLVFRDTPLRDAVTRMSRWFDIDVRLASSVDGNRVITAVFEEESITDVLPLIAASLNLELMQSGRIYTLRAK